MPSTKTAAEEIQFTDLISNPHLLKSIKEVGYETPTPIQAQTIPHLLSGQDFVGQAQTGTGKTAAFALPLLSRIDLKQKNTLVLVLTPTRELAIQVSEAFHRYGKFLKNLHVLSVYGGSSISNQIRELQRGVHVVVGTPGRVMDHMRRGTLKLGKLDALVLDEADEMLRMGFIDDVEWILEQTPSTRQTALFSATMPPPIRKIAQKYLKDPQEITVKVGTTAAVTINQRYCIASGMKKLDVLTRILEIEDTEGVLVFVRTKHSTELFADNLSAKGYACAALNGDISQKVRERTVEKLKDGQLNIVVATDVAARGLDVKRISHVINFDIPHDTESYVHRIGRTGRAGRTGEAILFVSPREKHLLSTIERATKQPIRQMQSPTLELVTQKRQEQFKAKIQKILDKEDLKAQYRLLEQFQQDEGWELQNISAALLKLVQTLNPALSQDIKEEYSYSNQRDNRDRPSGPRLDNNSRNKLSGDRETYRVEVGANHGIQVGNIVGAIANESGLSNDNIGRIKLYDNYSTVELPNDLPTEIIQHLGKVWVGGQQLKLAEIGSRNQGFDNRHRDSEQRSTRPFNKGRSFDHDRNEPDGDRKKTERKDSRFEPKKKKRKTKNKKSDDKVKTREFKESNVAVINQFLEKKKKKKKKKLVDKNKGKPKKKEKKG
jgi:ATP-dependent RNA helicase DeaD